MERHKARLLRSVIAATLVIASTAIPQNDIEDPGSFPGAWYRIAFDRDGNYLLGDGHGYSGGTWYYYPQTGWWRQWFYNQPYSASRQGVLEYQVYIKPVIAGQPSYAEIRFNWTTPQWSGLNRGRPPLPGDVPTTSLESTHMQSRHLYLVDNWLIGTIEPIASHVISEYNPEWVSIDIRGRNVHIYRGAFHECVPKNSAVGACYDPATGRCYQCVEGECLAPYQWLGPGSSCPEDQQPAPSPVPVYRLWSQTLSTHFYTMREDERDLLLSRIEEAWHDEGTAFRVLTQNARGDCRPVYRFRSDVLDSYFYTISDMERRFLMDNYPHVWAYQGTAFYAYEEGASPPDTWPVYRFWSPVLAHHFYTMSEVERDALIGNYPDAWHYEGVAWHAYRP